MRGQYSSSRSTVASSIGRRTCRDVLRRLDAEFPVIRSERLPPALLACRIGIGHRVAEEIQIDRAREHREALERCFELGRIQQCAWHRAESAASETAMASASSSTPAIGARMIGSSTPSKVLMEVMAARAVNWCRV